MQRFWNYARRNATAEPALAATITVYDAGSLVLSTLFADDLPIPTPRANPFTADANDAYFDFYAGNGHYDVQLSGGAAGHEIVTPYVWGDILLSDAGGFPIAVVQSELGGSHSAALDFLASPSTLPVIDYNDVYIPWPSLPVGIHAYLYVYGQAPIGGTIQAELFDLVGNAQVLLDPTPFNDDTQIVEHIIPLVTPNPAIVQVVRLRGIGVNAVGQAPLLYGRILYTP